MAWRSMPSHRALHFSCLTMQANFYSVLLYQGHPIPSGSEPISACSVSIAIASVSSSVVSVPVPVAVASVAWTWRRSTYRPHASLSYIMYYHAEFRKQGTLYSFA